MIIIWGSKHKPKKLGIVGDYCHVCNDLRRFEVVEHYKVGHVYYISLGSGTLVGTSKKCAQCKNEFHCESDDYADFVVGERQSIGDLIARTNPTLQRKLEQANELEDMASQAAASDPSDPTRIQLRRNLEKIRPYSLSDSASRLVRRLNNWDSLSTVEQEDLTLDIDEFVAGQEKSSDLIGFVENIAGSFPDMAGCLLAFLAFAIPIAAIFFVPALQTWIGWVYGLIAFGISVYVFTVQQAKAAHEWVRNVLIPDAEEAGVDLIDFCHFIEALSGQEDLKSEIQDLVNSLDDIIAGLIEEGMVPESMRKD